jgi:hypothetical protein
MTNRFRHAGDVQGLLTLYSAHIKTRLGLHEVRNGESSPNGLIVLEMWGDDRKCQELFDRLNAIAEVEVKAISFEHPAD